MLHRRKVLFPSSIVLYAHLLLKIGPSSHSAHFAPIITIFNISSSTGKVFCGNYGGVGGHRQEYTVIGDTVNLAARLMQKSTNDVCKKINHEIL